MGTNSLALGKLAAPLVEQKFMGLFVTDVEYTMNFFYWEDGTHELI